jgi:hypothetical protein
MKEGKSEAEDQTGLLLLPSQVKVDYELWEYPEIRRTWKWP